MGCAGDEKRNSPQKFSSVEQDAATIMRHSRTTFYSGTATLGVLSPVISLPEKREETIFKDCLKKDFGHV
jgi:hypothetical protein